MQIIFDFLSMGGYWAFVWSAYGVAAFILAGLMYLSLRNWRITKGEMIKLEAKSTQTKSSGGVSDSGVQLET